MAERQSRPAEPVVREGDTRPPAVVHDPERGISPKFEVVRKGGSGGDPDAKGIHANGTEPDNPAGQEDNSREAIEARVRRGIPEVPRPAAGTVLYATPGGFAVLPEGVKPEDVGSNAVGRS